MRLYLNKDFLLQNSGDWVWALPERQNGFDKEGEYTGIQKRVLKGLVSAF